MRIAPHVIPKRSLTGLSTGRVDTRVPQAVDSMKADALEAFPGQQVDVFQVDVFQVDVFQVDVFTEAKPRGSASEDPPDRT
ncbi:MAG: hypothetical protein NTU45_11110 [Planctomycetota bacterium]|nr:hypothetical protein [Planctomycetota bacterium]